MRQAIEAGLLLRMRNNQTWYPQAVPSSGPKPSNRWASYGTSIISMVPNTVSNKSSESTNTPFIASSHQSPPKLEHSAPLLHMFRQELAKIQKPMENFKIDQAWKAACEDAFKPASSLDSTSTAQSKQDPASTFNKELVEVVDDLMCGVSTLANEAQVRFTRLVENIDKTIEPEHKPINNGVLSAILWDFRSATQKATRNCREALLGVARDDGQLMDIATCQAVVNSLQELSKGIETFATLLSAAALAPQPSPRISQKSEFPNEPLEIEIGNVRPWLGTI